MDSQRHLCLSREREEQRACREPPRSDYRAFPVTPCVQPRITGESQRLSDVHFCCQSGWPATCVPEHVGAGEQEPSEIQRRWRTALFLRRTCQDTRTAV